MSSVTFPTAIGGDGSTVSDDDNVTTGLRNGGWRTRFIPCFTNLVNIANYMVSYTAQTSTFAAPPPMGSTTPNTGAFTRVTVTGSTVPVNGMYLPGTNILGFATNSTERVRIDASGNVGIGTSSPATKFHVSSTGSTPGLIERTGSNGVYLQLKDASGSSVYLGASNGVFAIQTLGSSYSDKLVIDSSGNVGIGTSSPQAKLDVRSGATTFAGQFLSTGTNTYGATTSTSLANATLQLTGGNASGSTTGIRLSQGGSFELYIGGVQESGGAGAFVWQGYSGSAYTERMRLDSSGNLGLGLTPSAWHSNFKALQAGTSGYGAFVVDGSNAYAEIVNNCYASGASTYNYIATLAATRYSQQLGSHKWYIAGAGSGGSAISWTQAMTLDASGNLLVGTTNTATNARIYCPTSNNASSVYCEASNTSQTTSVLSVVAARNTTNSSYKAIEYYNSGSGNTRFYVNDAGALFSTSTSITAISDINLKENIRPLETGLAEVLALQPRRFDWKNGDGKEIAGFIAQEVEPIFPDLVSDYKYNDEEIKKAVKMGDMLPTLVKAIQELSAELNELKAKVNA